jgi:hypothetical protein
VRDFISLLLCIFCLAVFCCARENKAELSVFRYE